MDNKVYLVPQKGMTFLLAQRAKGHTARSLIEPSNSLPVAGSEEMPVRDQPTTSNHASYVLNFPPG